MFTSATSIIPRRAPKTVPSPPVKLAPPITAPAIALVSAKSPAVGVATPNLATVMTPASPASSPLNVNTNLNLINIDT